MNTDLILKLIELLMSSDSSTVEPAVVVSSTVDKGRCIVIGNRGNIVVGDLTVTDGTGTLKNASVIRRWGTTKGLGQLALEGAQQNTVLDPCGEFELEMLTTCGIIKVKSNL